MTIDDLDHALRAARAAYQGLSDHDKALIDAMGSRTTRYGIARVYGDIWAGIRAVKARHEAL